MSYRLIDSNEIAIKYPEVNEMDCIYVDLPNGLDNEYHYIDAEPKHKGWIPVTERLPEESGRYLVTRGLNACGALWNRVYIINYSDLMGLKSGRIWWDGNVGKSDFERIEDVIAWMPLPKPYREVEE